MRKRLAALAVFASLALLSGCQCAEHAQIVELRKLHTAYRSAVVPRPDLSDLAKTKVEKLGQKLDSTLATLEELTE